MALQILKGESGAGSGIIADRRLCLTADKATIVDERDERAATLLCGEGAEISTADVARLSLAVVDGRVVQLQADEAEQSPVVEETTELPPSSEPEQPADPGQPLEPSAPSVDQPDAGQE